MTILAGTLVTLLLGMMGGYVHDLGRVTSDRVRAQTAADAAALAAIAESGPSGSGAHALMAARYAEANGAELLECRCPRGAYAVQVVVARSGVTAAARAAIDPTRLAPTIAPDLQGLHPELAAAVATLLAAAAGEVRLVSGFRSAAEQTLLWNRALARFGSAEAADDWVAPPGRSQHERGLAVDLGGDIGLAVRLVESLSLPLYRPLANEPWHFELVGARGSP